MVSSIRLVIFDMDGVMYDTERLAIQAWQAAGAKYGYTVAADTVVEMIGRTVEDCQTILRHEFGQDFPFALILEERLRIDKAQIERNTGPVKEGLFETLAGLGARGLKPAVATSTERARAERLMLRSQTPDCFAAVVCGDEVPVRKPAPDLFVEAARRVGCAPHECLVIEDTDVGIEAARRAGMRAVFVLDMKPLVGETVSYVAGQFDGLREFLAVAVGDGVAGTQCGTAQPRPTVRQP